MTSPLPQHLSPRAPHAPRALKAAQAVSAACLLTAILAPTGACTALDPAPAAALRTQFPAEAAQILEGEGGLSAAAEPSTAGRLSVELPRRGQAAVRLRLPEASAHKPPLEVQIHEIDAESEGTRSGRAVAYPRRGGTSFWVTAPGAAEEWLHLAPGIARAGQVAAAWQVEGATLRQPREGVIDLLDDRGEARLHVTAPVAITASGRSVEARLAIHGDRIEIEVDAAGEAVLIDPLWAMTAPLMTKRDQHTATLLQDGRVLVTGGTNGTVLTSVELYDPALDTWTSKAPMGRARVGHTATRLNDGRVLVIGGKDASTFLATAEVYTPASDTWATAGTMSTPRQFHTATLLANGKVLVAGGTNATASIVASAEIYDPGANSWTVTGSMSTARQFHTATLLAGAQAGKVLAVGGRSTAAVLASAEVYDPAMGTWTSTPVLANARELHTATLLPNGKVLAAGGRNGPSLATAELYDPPTNTWATTGALIGARYAHTDTLLGDGRVLAAAGFGTAILNTAELYDPASGTWTATASLAGARDLHTATLLNDGRVLLVGGFASGAFLATTEAFTLQGSNGSACTASSNCLSGFCVDNVCCDSACTGACKACSTSTKGSGANGTCGFVVPGRDPDDDCTPQTPSTCGATGFCDGAGACQKYPSGTQCAPASCMGNTALNVDLCDGNGTCVDGGSKACGASMCVGGICQTVSCTMDATCAPAGYCSGMICVPKQPNGADCIGAAQCQSGSCADGSCCDTACTGPCLACSASKKGSGTNGTCGFIDPGTDPDDECAAQGATTCGTTDVCDGAGACQKYPNGAECAPASCMGNTALNADLCDGNGNCVDGGSQACGAGTCVSGACQATPCVTDATCGPASYCNGTTCVRKKPNGAACAGANQCLTGFCADGVCCTSACDAGPCDACTKAGGAVADGTCTPLNGAACSDGTACTVGDSCQGGVCTSASVVTCTRGVCEISNTCDPVTGMCVVQQKLDGAPCPGGQCVAGGCLLDPGGSGAASGGMGSSGSSSGSSGSAPGSSSGGAGGGVSGGGGTGVSGAGGSGAEGSAGGGGEENAPIVLRGGACSWSAGGAAGSGAGWFGVGLLLGMGARRRGRGGRRRGRAAEGG